MTKAELIEALKPVSDDHIICIWYNGVWKTTFDITHGQLSLHEIDTTTRMPAVFFDAEG